ncbi:S100 calcium binding protein S isoform X1 [Maylandia zebra]|uniref:EF-hand domain-containing protein n=1 Tax=Astatotilapia calliptera TaxID=8154 RepID=A0A3P8PFF2_ASTCA|nr:protein S100-A1-like isoform X1 [Astatotilapia calliptera]
MKRVLFLLLLLLFLGFVFLENPSHSCFIDSDLSVSVCAQSLHESSTRSSTMPDTIMSKEPSSNLESAMQMLIKTFHKYSGKEGDKYTLSRGELKELLLEELGSYLGSSKDNEAVEKVMNDLDANNDGEVDFTEFIILMGALTVACNDFFLEFKTDDKPKDGESAQKKD